MGNGGPKLSNGYSLPCLVRCKWCCCSLPLTIQEVLDPGCHGRGIRSFDVCGAFFLGIERCMFQWQLSVKVHQIRYGIS